MGFNVFSNCTECKHCNSNKHPVRKSGDGDLSHYGYNYDYVWCSKRGQYVLKTDAQSWCFEKGSSSSSGCFLTSACVEHKGLADDCEELTKLRAFRDTYLKSTPEGCAIVEEYYKIAPQIVENIDHSSKKDEIYEYIYQEVHTCIACIEAGDNDGAVNVYRKMVQKADEMVKA